MSEIRVWRIYGTILRVIELFISPSAISATTGTGLVSNTGHKEERLVINHLSHGRALNEGQWSTEISTTLLREKEPLDILTGVWVYPRVRLDVIEKRRS